MHSTIAALPLTLKKTMNKPFFTTPTSISLKTELFVWASIKMAMI